MPVKTVTGSTTYTYADTVAGSPIAQKTGSTTRFFLKDLHGDTVGLVNTLAQDRMTLAFDPWGMRLGTTGTESTWFGFQTDPTDPDSGEVDMGTRWYETGLGRFTSRDVLLGDPHDPTSINQFAYAGGSPATFIDPTGMANAHVGGGCGSKTSAECNRAAQKYSEWTEQNYDQDCSCYGFDIAPSRPVVSAPVHADSGCGFLALSCVARAVGDATKWTAKKVYENKNLLAAAACIAMPGVGCAIAAGLAFLGNEIDTVNRMPGDWKSNMGEGAFWRSTGVNVLMGVATAVPAGAARAGLFGYTSAAGEVFPAAEGIPTWFKAQTLAITSAQSVITACYQDQVCHS